MQEHSRHATSRGRYQRYRRCRSHEQSRRGSHDLDAACLGSVAQVDFQHLTDVHTGRHAQRVQHDVQRGAVGQVGHVLLRQNAGNDTLVAVTACHLIANADLALLGDIAADDLAHAGLQFVAVLRGEHLDIHDDAVCTMGHAQRSITHFACLLAEDGAQQALFSGQLGLAFGVTLPTRMSPLLTSAPIRMMPRSSRSFSASSETLGISRVISSGPSLVSRLSVSYSSI